MIILAHQIEAMARQEKLRRVDHYLRPLRKPKHRDESEKVVALLDRLAAKQAPEGERD